MPAGSNAFDEWQCRRVLERPVRRDPVAKPNAAPVSLRSAPDQAPLACSATLGAAAPRVNHSANSRFGTQLIQAITG